MMIPIDYRTCVGRLETTDPQPNNDRSVVTMAHGSNDKQKCRGDREITMQSWRKILTGSGSGGRKNVPMYRVMLEALVEPRGKHGQGFSIPRRLISG